MFKNEFKSILFLCFFIYVNSHLKSPTIPSIINGNTAQFGQFPWHARVISFGVATNVTFCNGAIIDENWILTTASCLDKGDTIIVIAGTIFNDGINGQLLIADNFTIHENFDNNTLQNDIALIQLNNESISFNNNTKAIALPDDDDNLEEGVTATVTGWGYSNHDNSDNATILLQYTEVTTISNEDCQAVYGVDTISESVVCTSGGDSNQSPCFGDAGAPLVVNADRENAVLTGIFSFISALGCENYPAGYTRVAYYRKWIEEITGI